jgi:hypothetical protein
MRCDLSMPKLPGEREAMYRRKGQVRSAHLSTCYQVSLSIQSIRASLTSSREIERLKERVKELEEQLRASSIGHASLSEQQGIKVEPADDSVSLPINLDPYREHGGNKNYYNWDYIATQTTPSNFQCYGPSSSFYFFGRMASYLDVDLQRRSCVHTVPSNKWFACAIIAQRADSGNILGRSNDGTSSLHLLRSEEEYVLELFWQFHYWIYQVLDEAEFRAHYNSLWETSAITRQPSALVDIVLALCMQYGAASVPPRVVSDIESPELSDATIAGRQLYRRCQSLLTDEMEIPSIATFQCQLLSAVWLCNASLQNMAHGMMAMCVRTGKQDPLLHRYLKLFANSMIDLQALFSGSISNHASYCRRVKEPFVSDSGGQSMR